MPERGQGPQRCFASAQRTPAGWRPRGQSEPGLRFGLGGARREVGRTFRLQRQFRFRFKRERGQGRRFRLGLRFGFGIRQPFAPPSPRWPRPGFRLRRELGQLPQRPEEPELPELPKFAELRQRSGRRRFTVAPRAGRADVWDSPKNPAKSVLQGLVPDLARGRRGQRTAVSSRNQSAI